MFQFSGFALFRVLCLQHSGLPHSEIFGLSLVCSYPKLIAAYHVLLRLLSSRHPPCALIRFKFLKFKYFYFFILYFRIINMYLYILLILKNYFLVLLSNMSKIFFIRSTYKLSLLRFLNLQCCQFSSLSLLQVLPCFAMGMQR